MRSSSSTVVCMPTMYGQGIEDKVGLGRHHLDLSKSVNAGLRSVSRLVVYTSLRKFNPCCFNLWTDTVRIRQNEKEPLYKI